MLTTSLRDPLALALLRLALTTSAASCTDTLVRSVRRPADAAGAGADLGADGQGGRARADAGEQLGRADAGDAVTHDAGQDLGRPDAGDRPDAVEQLGRDDGAIARTDAGDVVAPDAGVDRADAIAPVDAPADAGEDLDAGDVARADAGVYEGAACSGTACGSDVPGCRCGCVWRDPTDTLRYTVGRLCCDEPHCRHSDPGGWTETDCDPDGPRGDEIEDCAERNVTACDSSTCEDLPGDEWTCGRCRFQRSLLDPWVEVDEPCCDVPCCRQTPADCPPAC